jgi:uncharacterized protein YbjT (DUF2867 family)
VNLLVVGATRGIGRQLVDQALVSGHSVTALARHPERLEPCAPAWRASRS